MIRDRLIPELKREFSASEITFGNPPNPIAVFPANQDAVGKVLIYDDGGEATVVIEKITHTHFNPYNPSLSPAERDEFVTNEVIDFLKALFADRILLAIHKSQRSAEWQELKGTPSVELSPDNRYYLWSKPFQPG